MRYMKYIINIALLLILVVSMMPCKVQAATSTLVVTGDGLCTNSYGGTPATWAGMNLDDDSTSYVYIYASGGSRSTGCWSVSSFPTGRTISSVTFYYKATQLFVDYWRINPFASRGGVTVDGASVSPTLSPTYTLYSYTWATDPISGGAWTSTNLNNTYFGIEPSDGSGSFYVTYVYAVVDYVSTVPPVTTLSADTPTYSGSSHNVTLNGSITDTGGSTVDLKGFVWSTTSNTTSPGNIVPPATYTSNWTASASGIESITHNVGGLTKGATYYYRAYAHNTLGWGWGDEMSVTMLNDPAISVLPATNVSTNTARLNSSVTSSGGQSAQVSFEYGTTSSYSFTSFTANTTHNTGDTPYADISGLTALGTSYTYRARIINDVSSQVSANSTFITAVGVTEPNSLTALPTATTVSLAWVKGSGSDKTLIRYKLGSYPASTTDGTSAYFDTQSSVSVTGLTMGSTYYFMAWGETSGIYSTSNTTLMVTTLAGSTATDNIPQPATPTGWFQAPDYTNMSAMPFYSIINFAADAFEIPKSTLWYMCAMFFCVAVGVFFYSTVGNANLFLSICAVGVMVIVCSLMKLIPMWQIFPFAIFAVVGIFVGERR